MLQLNAINQQDVWEFLYCRHAWEIQNFNLNNWKYEVPIPISPKHVLKPLEKDDELPTDNIPYYSTNKSQSHPTNLAHPKKKPQQQQQQKDQEEEDADTNSSTHDWMWTPPSEKATANPATQKTVKKTSALSVSPSKVKIKVDKPANSLAQPSSIPKKKREAEKVAAMAEEEMEGPKKKRARKEEEVEEEKDDEEEKVDEEDQLPATTVETEANKKGSTLRNSPRAKSNPQ